ncbi:hypothetical protein [Virgibacillus salinus]|nr:hypothetical protein [Virgibacillus salinus]
MEFDAVIIYNYDDYKMNENDFGRKLLYVATTQALHELVIF